MRHRNLALLIPVSLGIIALALWIYVFVAAASQVKRDVDVVNSKPAFEVRLDSQLPEPAAGADQVQPTESPQNAPVSPEPVTTQEPQDQAPVELVVIPYAKEMSDAGIAQSDQPTAARLLLNADGSWKTGNDLGIQVSSAGTSITDRFARANEYVSSSYRTWAIALNGYESRGTW